MYAIEIKNLTKRYGKMTALEDFSLSVAEGSIYGFIGPNGAGKTTTLRMLAGLLEPTEGEIHLMGKKLSRSGVEAQHLVGYMPDFFGVYDDLRVWEYLDFFARCYGIERQKRQATIDQLLDLVDLRPKREAFVQSLSRGMQQRLCLAHALVHNPPILILDEPASGLDPRARVELRELLRTLRDLGKTVFISSHILSELAEVSTEIGIIHHGKMVVSGPVAEVRRQLQEGNQLQIRVLHDAAKALELLQQIAKGQGREGLPLILEAQIDGSDPRLLHLTLDNATEEQLAALLSYLLAQKVAVSNYHVQAEELEKLFLRLTEVLP
jgi:ABC-2 type transport system ATP-binding protein